jgi:myosin XV
MQSTSIYYKKNFRFFFSHSHDEQIIKQGRNDKRSTGKNPHADLVKWQGKPLKAPLLKLPADLAPLALECFECVLRYCGDLPPDPELTEVKCVYTVLMVIIKELQKYSAERNM